MQSKKPRADVLAEHLQATQFDPQATRGYEIMSGSFYWSDEMPPESYDEIANGRAMRLLLGYRASLIRGAPKAEFQFIWDGVMDLCPTWPGFREERRSPELRDELETQGDKAMADLDRMSEVFERAQRIAEIRRSKSPGTNRRS